MARAVAVLAKLARARLWFARCERACAAADREAHELFERGDLLSALALIDRVDARCRCTRFISGDAPPQYALAQACVLRLVNDGRRAEADRALALARSPILTELRADRAAVERL